MRRCCGQGLLGLLIVLCAGAGQAALWDPFNGYVDLSAVQAEVDGADQDAFRQDYNLAFSHDITPYVDLRLAYRYFDYDLDFEFDPGTYRREKQPSGELRWNHPLFLASGSLMRREVDTAAQGAVVTNTTQLLAKTKDRRYPVFEVRYDEQHSYFKELRSERDIRNKRLQAGLDWELTHHTFQYVFTHDKSDNVVSTQTSRTNRNLFRWRGQGQPGSGKMRLAGNYTFSYVDQLTVNNSGGPVLRLTPIMVGLYAFTEVPGFVSLEPRSGLADGNTDAPVIPEIDLGGANVGHNLGADLGVVRAIGGLHIYTDRPSGLQQRWEVWGSDDNLTWELVTGVPQQVFNGALNRYELRFDAENYRYIKAVNSGLNEVAQVLVTEIEVLEQVSEHPENGLQASSHQADGRIDYRWNPRWNASGDISFAAEENPGRGGDRARGSAGARLNYIPSTVFLHNVNWQLANQWNGDLGHDVLENVLGYTLAVTPLETLRGSASVSDRLTWLQGDRSQRNTGGAIEGNTDLLRGLLLSVGAGASRSQDYLADYDFRSWNARGRIEASLTDALDLTFDLLYLQSKEVVRNNDLYRRSLGLGLDWRLTRTVYARASLRRISERSSQFTVDAVVSWNILPALRLSAQYYELGDDDLTTTLRRSANLNWELSRRANVYLRLAEVDLSGSGGNRTTSFQQGFRFTF